MNKAAAAIEVTHCYFCHNLLGTSKSQTQIQEEGAQTLCLDWRHGKILEDHGGRKLFFDADRSIILIFAFISTFSFGVCLCPNVSVLYECQSYWIRGSESLLAGLI